MKAIDLPAPHGFLIWRGKQIAIANNQPWPANEKLAIVSGGEVYGEVILNQAIGMTIADFDTKVEEHRIRPEDRKLRWNGANGLFVQWIKEFEPYHQLKACKIEDGELVLLAEPKLDDGCKSLLDKADRLPKIILLKEDVVILSGSEIKAGVDADIEPVIRATFDAFDLGSKALPLYDLALVKVPNMRFREEESMPYQKVKREGQWCVIKTTDGSTEKCYSTEAEADDFLTALNLNVEDKKKEGEEVIEPPTVEEDDKAVWSVAFVNNLPDSSFLYIEPGGEKDEENRTVPRTLRHFPYKDASGAVDLPHLRNALARIPQSGLSDTLKTRLTNEATAILERANKSGEKAGRRMAARMMDRLKDAWETMKDLLTWAEYDDEDEMKAIGYQAAVKMSDGDYWHFAWSTNAFQDREGEIFSTESLEKYVKEAEAQNNRGFFNFWHVATRDNPALSDFAEIKWQGVIGRMLVESGPYLPDAKGQAAKAFFVKYPNGHPDIAPEGWGSSPEYRYLPEERVTGVYKNIWKTRTSTLPRMAAANIWTKGGIMALSDQQLKAAQAVFGEELANQIIATAERQTKELEEAGVAHKEAPPEAPPAEVKQEVPPMEEEPEEKPAEKPADDLMAKLSEMADGMMAGMGAMAGKLEELAGRVDALESAGKMKAAVETPRWLTAAFERAATSDKTVVAEDDPLKDQKPAETTPKKEGAAAFFKSRN